MIDNPEIDWLRGEIDRIDHQILDLIHQRLEFVLQIGDKKRHLGLPVYDPKREEALLDSLASEAKPPLEKEAVLQVFRALVAECRRLESLHIEK